MARFFGKRRAQRLALVLAVAGMIVAVGMQRAVLYTDGFPAIGGTDFLEYWSAGRLLRAGGNPYDPVALLVVQREAGWPGPEPILMWNPPWTLALVLPLSFLGFGFATLVWLVLQVGIIVCSGMLLWRYFAPGDSRYWIGLVLAAGFVPGMFALRMGQISPWLLLGVVGFLCAARDQRDVLAGAALALLMIKPHVTYLFWPAALWWAWRGRRWRVLIGWLGALVFASGIAWAIEHAVFTNYWMAASEPPLYWAPPTLGTWLRWLFRPAPDWLQFLPTALGGVAALVWLIRRCGPWRWPQIAPPLLLASVATSAYAWSFDNVVLLPAVVAMVSLELPVSAKRRLVMIVGYAASQVMLLALNVWLPYELFVFWFPAVLAAIYWWYRVGSREPEQPAVAIG